MQPASAIEVQEGLSGHEIVQLRIGIHIGDVTYQDDDLYGDGINVAARLEAMAEPGQILISDTAYDSLDLKSAGKFGGGERHELKNIARPVTVWRWPATSEAIAAADPALSLPDKPSIAVLPFENMSNDADQGFFCRRHVRRHHYRALALAMALHYRAEHDLYLQRRECRRETRRPGTGG